MKTAHIVVSDLHIGSKLGLCPPAALIDLGGHYTPNAWQEWIWDRWNDSWDWMFQKIDKIKPDYVHMSVTGDMCDIDLKGRSSQIWSRSYPVVKNVAVEILEPIVNKVDTLMVVKGTEAHNGLSNDIEDLVADDFINSVPCEETGEPAWWSAEAMG